MAEITLLKEKKEREMVELPYLDELPLTENKKRADGRFLARKSVEDDKVRNISSLEDNSITAAMLQSNSVSQVKMQDNAVGQAEWKYEQVSVTVNSLATTGTATVTSGSIIIGWRATGNQDQLVDNISVSGTTLTITLADVATANNTFQVTLLRT